MKIERKKKLHITTKEIGNSTKCEESIEIEIDEWFNEWQGIDVKFKVMTHTDTCISTWMYGTKVWDLSSN